MILFAYAGNMNVAEFSKTVPSAKKIGVGKLPGYNLVFNKTAEDQSSKANITRSTEADAAVWGVLIELNDDEKPNFYNPDTWNSDFKLEEVTCFDASDNVFHAEAFVALPHATNIHLLPYDWYHQRIIDLARRAELPEPYIQQLSLMPYKTDPDEERRQRRLKKG